MATVKNILPPLLISVLAVSLLLAWTGFDLSQALAVASRLDWRLLPLFYLGLLLSMMLRTVRLRLLLGGVIPFGRLFGVSLLHHFYASLLPFRTGEAALPILLKQEGYSMAHALAVLVAARVLDLLSMVFYFFLLGWWQTDRLPPDSQPLWQAVWSGALLLVIALLLLMWGHRWLVARLVNFVARPAGRWLPRREWLIGRLMVFGEGLTRVQGKRLLAALLASLLVWLTGSMTMAWVIVTLGAERPLTLVLLGTVVSSLLGQVPVQGFAGIGTVEGVFVLAFVALGWEAGWALNCSLLLHALLLGACLLYGMLGWGMLRRR
ncbi:MAG: flippase-like domain-containing protein [Magnetococcales bacterium]|nr:flippase-like domain-containing protein [Magnetococcales bacterium]